MQTLNEESLSNIINLLKDDGEIVEESHVKLAYEILQNRSTTSAAYIIPKGGPKFNYSSGTEAEQLRLESYFNARKQMFKSLKVRKLGVMGLAEWLPELNVAKIVRQGKFMQVQGFAHKNGFLALYPEEALFLLDVGDIDLEYNGLLLSMQDAYGIVLSAKNECNSCTFDEYCVYGHLCRMGYRVQRYFEIDCIEEEFETSVSFSKRKRLDDSFQANSPKKPKIGVDIEKNLEDSLQISNTLINSINTDHTKLENSTTYRGWWFSEDNTMSEESEPYQSDVKIHETTIDLPNLGHCTDSTLVLHKLPNSLIPEQTCSWELEIKQIWFERLKKDDKPTSSLVYSKPRTIDTAHICKIARDWSDYKNLVEHAQEEKRQEMEKLLSCMYSGEIKPLVNPANVKSFKSVFKQIQILKKTNNSSFVQTKNKNLKICFNVYQTSPEKVFKKSNPGKPFARICVISASDPIPTLADARILYDSSECVPVKFALVNDGKVLFFGFDSIDIPVDEALM